MTYEVKMGVPVPAIIRIKKVSSLRTTLESMPVGGMVEVKGKSKQAISSLIHSATKATGRKFIQRSIDGAMAGIWRLS